MAEPPRPEMDHIHTWFGLTYSNYLILPRAVLQSAPDGWQERFVALLRELNDMYGHLDWPESYRVNAIGDGGRFVKDPIPHYQRGRTYIAPRPPDTTAVITVTWPKSEADTPPDGRELVTATVRTDDPTAHEDIYALLLGAGYDVDVTRG